MVLNGANVPRPSVAFINASKNPVPGYLFQFKNNNNNNNNNK